MATQIQLKRSLASIWVSVNPILAAGEIGIETDTLKGKVGNGATAWNNLPYVLVGETVAGNGTGVAGQIAIYTGINAIQPVAANTAFNKNFETSSINIKMDGTPTVGTLDTLARADHIHPSDTTKAALVINPSNTDILITNPDGQPIDSGKKFNDSGDSTNDVWSASQVITAINSALTSAMIYKGVLDCSSNPNYPESTSGWTYRVSVAGYIGGASGIAVEIGDTIVCLIDSPAGDQSTVGANWTIIQANIDGAVTTKDTIAVPNSIVVEGNSSGKVVKQSVATISSTGTINIPVGQTYNINGMPIAQNNIVGLTTVDSPAFSGLIINGVSANQIVQTNSAKQLTTVSINTAYNQNFETLASNIQMNGTAAVGGSVNIARADHIHPTDSTREPTINAGTTDQYWRGDKTWQTLPVFGTQYNTYANATLVNNTSQTNYIRALTYTTDTLPAGVYQFNWYGEAGVGNANRNLDIYVAMCQYSAFTGTITTSTTSATVTGTNTAFLTQLAVGQVLFRVSGSNYIKLGIISAIASNTSLTLTGNALVAAADVTYEGDYILGNPNYTIPTAYASSLNNNVMYPFSGGRALSLINALCEVNILYKVGTIGATTAYIRNSFFNMWRIT